MSDKLVFKEFETEVKTTEEDRVLEFVASSPKVDRDNEVIESGAFDLKNFRKNPCVLWSHIYSQPPIARSKKTWTDEDGKLRFKPEFPEEGDYPFADTIYKLAKAGFIKMCSVGFIPISFRYGEGTNEPYRTYEKVELLEISLASVGTNPEALQANCVKAIDQKVITKSEYDELLDMLKKVSEKEEEPQDEITDGDEEEYGELIEKELVEKPYEGEHSCHLKSGNYDRVRRKNCKIKKDGKCIDVIYGIKGEKIEMSSLRFKKDTWTAAAAKKVCDEYEGTFEAAKSMYDEERLDRILEAINSLEKRITDKVEHKVVESTKFVCGICGAETDVVCLFCKGPSEENYLSKLLKEYKDGEEEKEKQEKEEDAAIQVLIDKIKKAKKKESET